MSQTLTQKIDRFIITNPEFYSKVVRLLVPIVLQAIINNGVNMMDTIMVGRLGEAAISASSLANQFYSIFLFLCLGISAAGLVLASQYYGAGDKKTLRRVFDLIYQIVIIGALAFALVTSLFPAQIMRIFTSDAEVIELGVGYLRVTALIFLPHGVAMVSTNVIRSIGNAKLGLYVSIASFIINIGANYVFIFGKLGMPALGVVGAALGTLIARLVELAVVLYYFLRKETVLRYRPAGILKLPTKEMLHEFVRLGAPAIVSDSLLALATSMISVILGHMGKEIVSAYAIVMVIDRLASVAIQGGCSAAGVIVGQSVGEEKYQRAQREGITFLAMSVVIGLFGAIVVLLIGEWSIGLYAVEAHTAQIAAEMMKASAIVVFFMAIGDVLSKGVLRGGGDTRFLLVADVLFQWLASIPLGAIAGLVLGWTPFVVLLLLRVDFVIKAVWLTFRLKSGKWIHRAKTMND